MDTEGEKPELPHTDDPKSHDAEDSLSEVQPIETVVDDENGEDTVRFNDKEFTQLTSEDPKINKILQKGKLTSDRPVGWGVKAGGQSGNVKNDQIERRMAAQKLRGINQDKDE